MQKKQRANIKGLKQEVDHFSITLDNVPHADNFFYADRVDVKQDHDFILLTFATTKNPDDSEVSLCVQIAMPIELACIFLYKANFIDPSLSGELLFKVVENAATNIKKQFGEPRSVASFSIPKDPSLFRKFSSNFSTSCVIQGQSCIEFFQIPPSLLIDLTYGRNHQRSGEVNHVISVISSPTLHYHLLKETEKILKPHFKKGADNVISQ